MRIISGQCRSRKIDWPDTKVTRPITDRLRDHPSDALLLSELKVHALATDDPSTYVAAIERARMTILLCYRPSV